jgi:ABC-type nitrate/sulfonate/bicarbonate transport system substrate-binding protein
MPMQNYRELRALGLTRRRFARVAFVGAIGSLLAGCTATVAPATAKPSVPTGTSTGSPTIAPASGPTTAPAGVAAGTSKKIDFIYGGLTPHMWGFYAAMEMGYFNKYGLDVTLSAAQNSGQVPAALIGGGANIGAASATTLMGPVSQGAKIKVLSTLSTGTLGSLLSSPNVETPSSLRGGKVAVGGLGDLSHVTAYLMLQKLALDPDKDVTYVAIGDDASRMAAVQSGVAQAGVVNDTIAAKAASLGLHNLLSSQDANLSFPATNFAVLASTLTSSPEMLKALFNGLLDGNDWVYQANELDARTLLAKYYKVAPDDPSMLVAYQGSIVGTGMRNPPYIATDGFKTAIDFSSKFNAALKNVDLANLLDSSLLDSVVATRKKA